MGEKSRYRRLDNATSAIKNADPGVIKRIEIKNFMCHSNLKLDFNEGVNFISGLNGSGKSAILAAIVIGLGGKAAAMRRGHGLQDYLKSGEGSAVIALTLNNRSDLAGAYKPEHYGNTITVERRIAAGGSSSYKLKNEHGKVVSTKKEELTRMLDEFNIQLDNPVTILNQEVSKTFLQSYDPKALYQLFMKATMFEQIHNDIAQVSENINDTRDIIDRKRSSFNQLVKDVKKWQQLLEKHEGLDNIRLKVEELLAEYPWAVVAEKEEESDALAKKVGNIELELNKLTRNLEGLQESVNEAQAVYSACEEQGKKLTEESSESMHTREVSKRKVDAAKGELSRCTATYRSAKGNLENAEIEHGQIAQKIAELRRELAHDRSGEILAKEAHLRDLRQVMTDVESRMKTVEQYGKELAVNTQQLSEEVQSLRKADDLLRHKLEELTQNIRQLEAGRQNRAQRFGAGIPELLAAIEKTRFKRRPRGPIGLGITVKDERWAYAVETCLGYNLLITFVCDNFADSKVLENLMRSRRMRQVPQIIVSPFGNELPYDTSESEPNCNCPTVLSVLEFNDSVVRNSLIDQRGIENIILVENTMDLKRMMRDENVPYNCTEGFDVQGNQAYANPHRFYANRQSEGRARFLTKSVEDVLRLIIMERERLVMEKEAKQQELNERTKRKNDLTSLQQQNATEFQRLQTKLQTSKRRERDLQRDIEESQPSTVNINALEEDLARCDEQLLQLQEVAEASNATQEAANEKLQQAVAEHKAVDRMCAQFGDRVNELEAKMVESSKQLQQCRTNYNRFQKQITEFEKNRDTLREKKTQKDAEVMAKITEAQTCSERPIKLSLKSSAEYDKHVTAYKRKLETSEATLGSKAEVEKNLLERKEKAKRIKQDIIEMIQVIELVEEELKNRTSGLKLLQQLTSMKVKVQFCHNLELRGYQGKLTIQDNKITIKVEVTQKDKFNESVSRKRSADGARLQDLKGLSGGERSYSTVCFILALWEALDAPFRCMDEFDVFMDMVNRRLSMDMLLYFATEQRAYNQFIFLTPLDMSYVPEKPTISVFKLTNPRKRKADASIEEQSQDLLGLN